MAALQPALSWDFLHHVIESMALILLNKGQDTLAQYRLCSGNHTYKHWKLVFRSILQAADCKGIQSRLTCWNMLLLAMAARPDEAPAGNAC